MDIKSRGVAKRYVENNEGEFDRLEQSIIIRGNTEDNEIYVAPYGIYFRREDFETLFREIDEEKAIRK